MKEIKLSQQGKNKGKYVALVDDEDYERVNQYRWHVVKCKHTYYALSSMTISGMKKGMPMHRFILDTPTELEVDHGDRFGLNNQRYNIKNCTHLENMQNLGVRRPSVQQRTGKNKKYTPTPTGIKYIHLQQGIRKYTSALGQTRVYYSKPKYVIHIRVNGRLKDFGRFKTEKEAISHLEILKRTYAL